MRAALNGNRVSAPPAHCSDPVFLAKARTAFVWLPACGMGWLPVADAPYDADYFAKYEGYADTELGREITTARRDLVLRYCNRADTLCDVGIGCGDFLETIRHALESRGFDINPAAVNWLNARFLLASPYVQQFDALTFWDALEHIPDVYRMIENARRWVFCSLPIVQGDGPPTPDWRHYRTDEHCWYFTRAGLVAWMDAQGFDCDEVNSQETLLGRLDIETFVFRRRGA